MACAVTASLLAVGCEQPEFHHESTDRRSVPLGTAKVAQVRLDMGAGELRVEGGAENLLDADFTFTTRARPEVRYDVSNAKGFLTVRQPPSRGLRGGGRTSGTFA